MHSRIGRGPWRWAIVFLGLGLAWRTVRLAVNFPLSFDEASIAVHLLDRGYGGLTAPLGYAQVAPVGFLWAELAAARLMGFAEAALRLPAWLLSVAALGLFWSFARKVLDGRRALLAIAIFASSYYLVRHGAEVKPYAGDVLIALGIVTLAWGVLEDELALVPKAGLTIVAAAGVWFSYPAVFVAAGAGAVLSRRALRSRSRGAFLFAAIYGLLLAASFLAMYLWIGRYQARDVPSWMADYWLDAFPPLKQPLRLLWWLVDIHCGAMLAYPVGAAHFGSTLTLICVAAGAVGMARERRDLVLLLLSPLPFAFLAAALHLYPYGDAVRTSLFMAPSFCLLAGAGLVALLKAALPRRRAPRGILFAAAVLAILPAAGMALDVAQPYKELAEYRTRELLLTLCSRSAPEDEWIVVAGGFEAQFRFYLERFSAGPIRWAAGAADLSRPGPARFRLIAYAHLDTRLPKDRLDTFIASLTARQGWCRREVFPLDDRVIQVFEFGTPPVRAAAPSVAAVD